MKKVLPILLSTILVGCTSEPPKQPAADAAVAGAQSCILLNQVAGRRVMPPNSIMFVVAGPVNYRNDLMDDCPGIARLGSGAAIEFDNPTGRRICRGDRVRVFDPTEARVGGIRSVPVCRLGNFVPVPHN